MFAAPKAAQPKTRRVNDITEVQNKDYRRVFLEIIFIYSLSFVCSTSLGSSYLPSPARAPSFYPVPQAHGIYFAAWDQRDLTEGLGKSQNLTY